MPNHQEFVYHHVLYFSYRLCEVHHHANQNIAICSLYSFNLPHHASLNFVAMLKIVFWFDIHRHFPPIYYVLHQAERQSLVQALFPIHHPKSSQWEEQNLP